MYVLSSVFSSVRLPVCPSVCKSVVAGPCLGLIERSNLRSKVVIEVKVKFVLQPGHRQKQ